MTNTESFKPPKAITLACRLAKNAYSRDGYYNNWQDLNPLDGCIDQAKEIKNIILNQQIKSKHILSTCSNTAKMEHQLQQLMPQHAIVSGDLVLPHQPHNSTHLQHNAYFLPFPNNQFGTLIDILGASWHAIHQLRLSLTQRYRQMRVTHLVEEYHRTLETGGLFITDTTTGSHLTNEFQYLTKFYFRDLGFYKNPQTQISLHAFKAH